MTGTNAPSLSNETSANEANEAHDVEDILNDDHLTHLNGVALLDALLDTRIGRDIAVPTTNGMTRYIHWDHSVSTPSFVPVFDAFCRTMRHEWSAQQNIVEQARAV
ncbi:MAG: hypothetical protein JXR76_23015 [Deltaproteobacteria bacterium]|nr:hypothetical protein [Deltaproteobacteria bacterium]